MSYIFGPVASRRLGYSLGVDIVPRKVCTLDCVYCQVGRTTEKTIERKEWVSSRLVLKELEEAMSNVKKVDYITLSGSGEPTLNSAIGKIIKEIKAMFTIPVAVLTNGTLLYHPEVRNDLMDADLVVPSFDAASDDVFQAINRPHKDINTGKILEGIKALRRDFKGKLWLEIMVIKDINDSTEELTLIADSIKSCAPDKIQINSVVRPPVEEKIEAATPETLQHARDIFGNNAEIIGDFTKGMISFTQDDIQEAIIGLIKRRPCSLRQISQSLGIEETAVARKVQIMVKGNIITETVQNREKFYKAI